MVDGYMLSTLQVDKLLQSTNKLNTAAAIAARAIINSVEKINQLDDREANGGVDNYYSSLTQEINTIAYEIKHSGIPAVVTWVHKKAYVTWGVEI